MIKTQIINKSINKGIDFLAKEQDRDGSFLIFFTANPKKFQQARKYRTVFSTALILQCLNTLKEDTKIKAIKRKAADFLLSQKSEHWTFNYWARQAKEFKTMPYPDDLDDTSCALAALFKHNSKIINGSVMGKFVMVLTALEEKEGGPYRTWLVKPDAEKVWKDVDLAVNSNLAYFLSLQDISLDNLNFLIEMAIDNKKYSSPYYSSEYPVIYFISRFYRGDKTQKIIDFLFSEQDKNGKWDNPLNTALVVSALLNLGIAPEKLSKNISYLFKNQNKGFWRPYPFYIDVKKYYAGSSALTTAFCLEALQKYLTFSQNRKTVQKTELPTSKQTEIYNSITQLANKRCSLFNGDLKKQALKALSQTLKTNKDKQIVLLPYFFKTALGKRAKNISDEKLIQLGLANLYGWTAYTIYDDFLDEEGRPELLSAANAFLRGLTTIFNNVVPPESGFPDFFSQTMDCLDNANTWEVNHCRIRSRGKQLNVPDTLPVYGDYTKLAERSLGHALTPIAILFLLGYKEKSEEIKKVSAFFKHYIIARQLNDDAHDWEKDLKRGQIDSVGADVLRKWKEATPLKQQREADILKIMPDLQKIFWYDVIPEVCQTVLKRTELAEKSLKAISLISNPLVMTNLLKPVRYSAQKALAEREETIKFLKSYKL